MRGHHVVGEARVLLWVRYINIPELNLLGRQSALLSVRGGVLTLLLPARRLRDGGGSR